MKYILLLASLTSILFLSACKPYEMDIPQGKILTEQQILHIKKGMSKESVLQILGSPLQGISPYDTNRLDYISTIQKNGGDIEENRLSIYLKNNTVEKIVRQNQNAKV